MALSVSTSYASSLYASSSNALGKNQASQTSSRSSTGSNIIDQFLAYQDLTPQEKIRDSVLKKFGLTEDMLDTLSPDDRKLIEEDIKQEILSQVKDSMAKKGVLLDITV